MSVSAACWAGRPESFRISVLLRRRLGFAPGVNLPLFNFGRLINQVKLNKEVKEEYVYLYQKYAADGGRGSKNATVSVRKEYERYQSLQRSVRSMQKVLVSMKDKYKEGLIEFSDLLMTEQNLLKHKTTSPNRKAAFIVT